MHKHNGKQKLYLVLTACILAALACNLPESTEALTAITTTSTHLAASATPAEAEPAATATPTESEPVPTATLTPIPPTPTVSPIPATDTLDISGWLNVIGTWSGCADGEEPGVPYATIPCGGPTGRFVTLWIKPTCTIGEYCGNYVKGMFESEFIRLKLTLIGIKGPVVWMHGVSSSPIYSYADTDVAIQREGGSRVRITEKAGDKWIYVLRPRCDPVIVEDTTFGCFEYLS